MGNFTVSLRGGKEHGYFVLATPLYQTRYLWQGNEPYNKSDGCNTMRRKAVGRINHDPGSQGSRFYAAHGLDFTPRTLSILDRAWSRFYVAKYSFSLKQIQKVLGRDDFDQLSALYSHRKSLSQEWEKIGLLLKTIDKTIKHLKGKKKMKDQEIFDGFNVGIVTRAKGHESYFAAEEIVVKSVKNPTKSTQDVEKRGKAFYENINKTAHVIFKDLVHCLDKGMEPDSDEVQRIMKKHHAFTEQIHNATQEVYRALAQLYQEHPVFRKQLDPFHSELAVFMGQAMKVFADRKLS